METSDVKIVFVVVFEEFYGGEELVWVFERQEDAEKYSNAVSKKRNKDSIILKRVIRSATETTH